MIVTKSPVEVDDNDTSRFDSFSSLGPDEKYAEGFILDKPPGFMVSSLGVVEVKWSTSMGEHGFVRGEELVAPVAYPSLFDVNSDINSSSVISSSIPAQLNLPGPPVSDNSRNIYRNLGPSGRATRNSRSSSVGNQNNIMKSLSFHCIDCPDTTVSGKEFEIKIRVFNDNYTSPANISLRCSNPCQGREGSLGLLVVGRISWSIGVLPPREFVDLSVHVVAMSSGLHEFGSIYVTDLNTRTKEYCSESAIAKIFIVSS